MLQGELPPGPPLAVPVVINKSLSFSEKADVYPGYCISFYVPEERLRGITTEKINHRPIVSPCPCAGVEQHNPSIGPRHRDQCLQIPVA